MDRLVKSPAAAPALSRTLRRGLLSVLAALGLGLLLSPAETPPAVPPAEQSMRNFTIHANALSIQPGQETTYLRFSGGVSASGRGGMPLVQGSAGAEIQVSAAELEVDLETGDLGSFDTYKLPEVDEPRERIADDPGKVAADMALKLNLPSPSFSPSALKRLGAAGNITLTTEGLTLKAGQIVSADGGRSWSASGGCAITRKTAAHGKEPPVAYEISASNLVYDIQNERAAAQGELGLSIQRGKDSPLTVKAAQGDLDLKQQLLNVYGGLSAAYGDIGITCDGLTADLKSGRISTSGIANFSDSKLGVSVSAASAQINLRERSFTAGGGVDATATQDGVTLSAEQATGKLPEASGGKDGSTQDAQAGTVIVLTGNPVVHYKESSFSGKTITLRQETGKSGKPRTVIEVEGPQRAVLNLDELPKPKARSGK